jgi:hypothetical protein
VVDDGVRDGFVFLGWSDAEGLLPCEDYWDFREIVHSTYYAEDDNYRRSGQAASQLWNFIHEINAGDLVVVPHGPAFYVGEIAGDAEYDYNAGPVDTAHRRRVRWLNDGDSIPRTHARSGLISRMRSQKTVTSAADLLLEITEALGSAPDGKAPTLATSLREALTRTTREQLLTGYMDERRFEELVRDLMVALGAVDAHVVARQHDIGADIEAEFSVGHFATIRYASRSSTGAGKRDARPVDQLLNSWPMSTLASLLRRRTSVTRCVSTRPSVRGDRQATSCSSTETSCAVSSSTMASPRCSLVAPVS